MSDTQKLIVGTIAVMCIVLFAVLAVRRQRPTEGKGAATEPSSATFDEVARAKDGERVTLIDWIDEKYVCNDVTETQREICTTALTRSEPPAFQVRSLEIRLRVCSETRHANCIVFPQDIRHADFRDIYVLDKHGDVIDFDGQQLTEPPNTWTTNPVKLKLTGTVRVVNGKGQILDPIEEIEAS